MTYKAKTKPCSGGEDGWRRPNCPNRTGRDDGLCDACRQRKSYWTKERNEIRVKGKR